MFRINNPDILTTVIDVSSNDDSDAEIDFDEKTQLDEKEDSNSFYDSSENIFKSIPPNNHTFVNKTYEEILEIDDLITIVLANVKNPPSFVLSDFSFIKYGFHKRLMKYTPKNCSCITTEIIIIADKELFKMYHILLRKPKKLYQINNILAKKDYFMCPPTINDIIHIKNILFNKVFDKHGDILMFKTEDGIKLINKRQFNFNTIRECIDSDQYIMERLSTIRGDYNRQETGITNNTIFTDGRNHFYYMKYNKIEKKQDEDVNDFIARVDMIKSNEYVRKRQEYLEIKTMLISLKRLITYHNFNKESLTKHGVEIFINCVIDRLFKSHRHYSFALRDLKDFMLLGKISSSAIWCAIYAYYVEECNSSVKVSNHTFRNYTDHTAHYLFTEDDIPLLNYIRNIDYVNNENVYGSSHVSNEDIFIPINRSRCDLLQTLPKKYNGSRKNRRINEMDCFRNRFDIFSRGMFKNFNWMGGAVMISGSCITACLAHFEECGNTKEQFKQFLKKNYENSDIDICTSDNYLQKLQKNIFELFYEKEPESVVSFYASVEEEKQIDMDDFNCEENLVVCSHCGSKQIDLTKNEIHTITCHKAKSFIKNSSRRGSKIYKLSIDPPKGDEHFRSIDVYSNTLGKIALYHMPCVRAAYTGEHLYMYPSFVCAALSGYCADYKWFKGKKNPLKIILDKWMKGFNIILNRQEQIQLLSYFIYNFPNEAKNNTPCLENYRTRWEQTFNYDNSIREISRNINIQLHSIDLTFTDEEVTKMIIQLYI